MLSTRKPSAILALERGTQGHGQGERRGGEERRLSGNLFKLLRGHLPSSRSSSITFSPALGRTLKGDGGLGFYYSRELRCTTVQCAKGVLYKCNQSCFIDTSNLLIFLDCSGKIRAAGGESRDTCRRGGGQGWTSRDAINLESN